MITFESTGCALFENLPQNIENYYHSKWSSDYLSAKFRYSAAPLSGGGGGFVGDGCSYNSGGVKSDPITVLLVVAAAAADAVVCCNQYASLNLINGLVAVSRPSINSAVNPAVSWMWINFRRYKISIAAGHDQQ